LYARIYHDLWEQKADRDAIVICYNRYKRCDEATKEGEGPSVPKTPAPSRSESRREPPRTDEPEKERPAEAKWSGPGVLREVARVFVDGQQVYALQDDRGQVLYYTTAAGNTNLKAYNDRRVQLYGVVTQKPTLYRPHLAAERIEAAR
jgi:hypothetical protein